MFRSNRGVFAQLIDDDAARTMAAVSWTEPELRKLRPASRPSEPASSWLSEPSSRVETCVFDRGGYQYHGRVKALAEGARGSGLTF